MGVENGMVAAFVDFCARAVRTPPCPCGALSCPAHMQRGGAMWHTELPRSHAVRSPTAWAHLPSTLQGVEPTGATLYPERADDFAAGLLHPQRGDLYCATLLVATRQQQRRYPHLPAPALNPRCYSVDLNPGRMQRYSDLAGRRSLSRSLPPTPPHPYPFRSMWTLVRHFRCRMRAASCTA